MATRTNHLLDVAGARLHYEVRGSGPTLLLIPGSNGDAGFFDAVADLLADRYTVVGYDRRGFSRSPVREEWQGEWVDVHTEDASRLLDAVAEGPAHVFGSSAGAVIGLALIGRHPQRVGRLVAHEPPLAEVLPDATRWQAFFQDVDVTYQNNGTEAAMRRFLTGIGVDAAERPADPDPQLISRMSRNLHTILTREVPNAPRYRPDLAALDAQHTRITLAGGARFPRSLPLPPSRHARCPVEPAGRGFPRRTPRLLDRPRRVRHHLGRRRGRVALPGTLLTPGVDVVARLWPPGVPEPTVPTASRPGDLTPGYAWTFRRGVQRPAFRLIVNITVDAGMTVSSVLVCLM